MVTWPPSVTPEVPNGITVEGNRGPVSSVPSTLLRGPLVATVMLRSAQSEAGTYPPGERGVLLPRRWIKATRVGSQVPSTLVHFVGPCECYTRLGSTWPVWFLVTLVA